MPPKESLYPVDWLRIAEKELKRPVAYIETEQPRGG